jgi:predicted nucleic acid-binding protein
MRLFLDSSILLAAAGSDQSAARHVLEIAAARKWTLITSFYCMAEVARNIGQLGPEAERVWEKRVKPCCLVGQDCWTLDRPLLPMKSKDRPVLLTALAEECEVLLTLDRVDFGHFFERGVYGMKVMTPGMWVKLCRDKEKF